ncbi:hypothetical protein cyc_03200 [Cyclospora cayetanensis]|uniref:Uncharacterized protein n=1 Tax=Cyclospora cayetanensis TaxID=88456 RepID=A0A1D3D9M4_9EIME|nr:hypothetical protein cyc_03200 [Cyclospora cayetanensis]
MPQKSHAAAAAAKLSLIRLRQNSVIGTATELLQRLSQLKQYASLVAAALSPFLMHLNELLQQAPATRDIVPWYTGAACIGHVEP